MSNQIKVRVGNQNAVKVVSSLAETLVDLYQVYLDVEINNPQKWYDSRIQRNHG